MATIRAFSPKLGHFFPIFEKGQGRPPPSSSCTSEADLIFDSGVHPLLHQNCHHQVVHCTLNINIELPPLYHCRVWDHNKTKTENIQKVIRQANWENQFYNKPVHKQVLTFNEILTSIPFLFIVSFDDISPPWVNEFIKGKMEK